MLVEGVRFDVFLSYNRADEAAVTRLAERLRERGIQPWLDRWALTPGGGWQQEIVQGLRASRACAVIVGPHGLGAWAREELGVAYDRAAKDGGFRLFMVLLPGAPEPDDPSLAFLRNRTWVDLHAGIDDPYALQSMMGAITGVAARRPAVSAAPTPGPRGGVTANPAATAAQVVGVAALITGALPFTAQFGVVLALIALVLGVIGFARGRRPNTAGTRAAVGGLLTGFAGLIAGGAWVAVYFAQPSPVQGVSLEAESILEAAREQESALRPVNSLAIGECFNSQTETVDPVFVVPCAQPHQREVFAILYFQEGPGAPYPGSTVMLEAADGQCRADPYTDYIGGFDAFSRPQVTAFHPSQGNWAAGDRVIICTVSDPAAPDGLTTGSLRGSAERIGLPTSPQPSSPPPVGVPRPLPPSPT